MVFSGLTYPTAVRFAPDGHVFVAEQSGIIKEFDSVSDTTPSIYADLRTNVHNYDDRGLLGLAVDPNWPTNPYVYVSYAYDAPIGGQAPRWGSVDTTSDPCPDPTTNGCVISGRLSRLQKNTVSVAYRDAVLADNPAAFWRLGEASGTTAADSSGNNRPGSYAGSPALGLAGALAGDPDTAVGFNGSSQYVEAPYSAAFNPNAFSVEAWAYVTGGQGLKRDVAASRSYDWSSLTSRGWVLEADEYNTWTIALGSGGQKWNVLRGPPVELNRWTHVAATYDGTTARLYVDGQLAASAALTYSPNTTRPLRIAANAESSTPGFYLPGRVDEVAVYGSALSATRVQAHYQAAQVGGSNQPPTAVATASPTSGPVPLIVNFDGSGSSDPDGDPITYSWDLNGDGVFGDSTVAKPSYTYTQAGSYTVKLKVTDSKGASSTSSPIAIGATNPPNAYRDAVLSDTPAAFWRLGEASGTTTADASGNNRAGSYIDSPTLGLTGALVGDSNTAAGFNGSGQYVQVPFSSALNPSSFTVEAWVYLAGGQGTQRSVVTSRDQGSKMTRGYWLLADSTNTWQLWLGTGGNHWSKLVGPAVTLNQWTHLVASYDGTTARLYVNGVQLASGSRTYVRNVVRPLRLAAGRTEGNPNAFFPGRLDEVAIYSAALSAARVQTHYNAGTGN